MYKIITVSRQFGSGGRTVGKETALRLGIPCYDREIIEKVAQKSGFATEYIEQQGEYSTSKSWFGKLFESSARFEGMSNQDKIWVEQRKIILELSKSPCVIVGRCADYILKGQDDVLNVFIHANDNFRAERIISIYGEKPEKIEKRLKDKDKRRSAYYKFYTETEWGRADKYHISLDSGKLGIEQCVEILTDVYKSGQ